MDRWIGILLLLALGGCGLIVPEDESHVRLEGLTLQLNGVRTVGYDSNHQRYSYRYWAARPHYGLGISYPRWWALDQPEGRASAQVMYTGDGNLAFLPNGRFSLQLEAEVTHFCGSVEPCPPTTEPVTFSAEGTYVRDGYLLRLDTSSGHAVAATVGRSDDGRPVVALRAPPYPVVGSMPWHYGMEALVFAEGESPLAEFTPPQPSVSRLQSGSWTLTHLGLPSTSNINPLPTLISPRFWPNFLIDGSLQLTDGTFVIRLRAGTATDPAVSCTAQGQAVGAIGIVHFSPGMESESFGVVRGDTLEVRHAFRYINLAQCTNRQEGLGGFFARE